MNTLHAIYALSTVGAATFYAAGLLTRSKAKAPTTPELPAAERAELETQIATLQARLETSQSESRDQKLALDVTQKQRETAAGEYEREKAARAAAEATRAQVQAQLASLQSQLEQAKKQVAAGESSSGEVARLNAALAGERKARLEAEGSVAAEHTRVDAAHKELERLRANLAKATAAGAAAGAAAAQVAKPQQDQRVEVALRSEVETLRSQIAAKEKRNAELVRQLEQAKSDANTIRERADRAASLESQAQREVQRLQERLNRLEKDLADSERENAELQSALTRANAGSADLEKLRQDNVELRDVLARQASSNTASADLQKDIQRLKIELDVALRKAATADELRSELESLHSKLKEVESKESEGDEGMREQARQLRLDLGVAIRRVTDLQSSAEEAASLREQVRMLSGATEEAAQLRLRLRALESIAIASGSPHEPEKPSLIEAKGVDPEARSMLDRELAAVASANNIHSVALADHLGLLVAAAGESSYHEGMAAMAGLVSEFAGRTVDYVSISTLRRLHVVDTNNVVLSCEMLRWHQDPVVMITLSAGMPPTATIGATVAALAEAGLTTP